MSQKQIVKVYLNKIASTTLTLPTSSCTHPSRGMDTCLCICMCNYCTGGGCLVHCSALFNSRLEQEKKLKQTKRGILQQVNKLQTGFTTTFQSSLWKPMHESKQLQRGLHHIVIGGGDCVENNSCVLLEMKGQVLARA